MPAACEALLSAFILLMLAIKAIICIVGAHEMDKMEKTKEKKMGWDIKEVDLLQNDEGEHWIIIHL